MNHSGLLKSRSGLIFYVKAMRGSTWWSDTAAALEGDIWRATNEAGGWQREGRGKRGQEQHVPMHCTETFPLNETFPLKDMRSQNFVKWPLGN